ncbi:hypothetical protein [Caulobacter endophyticus]|uniref:Uncharacterized protein n=1 Tax=Caulobacter endophyticus TaxID=2172652 RepID=A0A2T9K7D5_9CAUL|nr:hypothetical protein [Caulobacter endophyticus]PVM91878.1 hypothetical protein DDF67_06495 [Caulobacter endophyticus]
MRRDLSKYPLLALPILGGQFLFDVFDDGFMDAVRHFPTRLLIMGVLVASICLATWAWRRRKRTFR